MEAIINTKATIRQIRSSDVPRDIKEYQIDANKTYLKSLQKKLAEAKHILQEMGEPA